MLDTIFLSGGAGLRLQTLLRGDSRRVLSCPCPFLVGSDTLFEQSHKVEQLKQVLLTASFDFKRS